MNISIDEKEIQEYVDKSVKSQIKKLVELKMDSYGWKEMVIQVTATQVKACLSEQIINNIINNLDHNELIKIIASAVATEIGDRLYTGT